MHPVRGLARRNLPTALIFALVVLTLEAQSIWWDEGISLHLASLPWREVLAERAANIHPPLYFLLLKGWTALAGSTPFTGRFLSALAVTLLPASASRFVGRRTGKRAGRVAALLVALAPPFVVYGQELRAYALLPLGILGLWSLVWPATGSGSPQGSRLRWIRVGALGLLQAGLLLTHYVGAIACAAAALAYLGRALLSPRGLARRRLAREWVWGAVTTAVLVSPWTLILASTGLAGLSGQAGLANPTASPVTARYVAGLLGIFHITGLPAALGDATLVRLSALAALLLSLGVLQGLVTRGRRATIATGTFLWLLPIVSAAVIWTLSPQSHPRYLFAFVIGGWIAAAVVISAPSVHRLVRSGLLAALLVTSLLSVRAYLTEPDYARSDVRAVAAYLEDSAALGDVVIVPFTDWSLLQYDLGVAEPVMSPPYAQWDQEAPGLAEALGAAQRIYVLDYARGATDPGGALRAALVGSGALTERISFTGVTLEVYEMTATIEAPEWRLLGVSCVPDGTLCMEAGSYLGEPVSGAAMPVALQWRGRAPGARYGVALRLYDRSGALVAAEDDLLVDGALAPTSLWKGEREIASYHVLPLPVGLLPVPYRLEAGVFDWTDADAVVTLTPVGGRPAPSVVLGDVVPVTAPWRDSSLYGLRGPSEAVSEAVTALLRLEAGGVDRATAGRGDTVFVSTLWREIGNMAAATEVQVVLVQEGVVLAAAPLQVGGPNIPQGRPLLHGVALSVPSSASSGRAQVEASAGEYAVVLGEVTVDVAAPVYEAPLAAYPVTARAGDVATLLGYDLDPGAEATGGAPYTVTLQWRAESGASVTDLKVFAHLVVGGEIAAQDDAVPANWSRPTRGWSSGEIIADVHSLTWQTPEAAGEGTLYVGLYDPRSGKRVVWQTGEDRFALPVAISVRLSE